MKPLTFNGFVKPVVEELQDLWIQGVKVKGASCNNEEFTMRAIVMGVVLDLKRTKKITCVVTK